MKLKLRLNNDKKKQVEEKLTDIILFIAFFLIIAEWLIFINWSFSRVCSKT
mgnify:CR=1 FL=1